MKTFTFENTLKYGRRTPEFIIYVGFGVNFVFTLRFIFWGIKIMFPLRRDKNE